MTDTQLMTVETHLVGFANSESELQTLERLSQTTVFDYEDPKGNKDARSWVFRLRQLKVVIDDERKKSKRQVDSIGNSMISRVETMIQFHADKIHEIEERERNILSAIENIKLKYAHCSIFSSVLDLKAVLATMEDLNQSFPTVSPSFGKFATQALSAILLGIEQVKSFIPTAEKREADAKELEDLRREKALQEYAKNNAPRKVPLQISDESNEHFSVPVESMLANQGILPQTGPQTPPPSNPTRTQALLHSSSSVRALRMIEVKNALCRFPISANTAEAIASAIFTGVIPWICFDGDE